MPKLQFAERNLIGILADAQAQGTPLKDYLIEWMFDEIVKGNVFSIMDFQGTETLVLETEAQVRAYFANKG